MRIKTIPTIIAAAISALLAYGLYALCKTEGQELLLSLGGFIGLFMTLATSIGVSLEGRGTASTAVTGGLFFALMLVSNAIFAFVNFTTPAYVVVNGILLLVMLIIVYAIAKAKQ